MSATVDARLKVLLGSDYKTQPVERILETTHPMFTNPDVSHLDIMWVYEHLLEERDSPETRKGIAEQLNINSEPDSSRPKAYTVVRWLSQGNPAYERIDSDLILPHLNRKLQEQAVLAQVEAREVMRVAADASCPDERIQRLVDTEIEKRLMPRGQRLKAIRKLK